MTTLTVRSRGAIRADLLARGQRFPGEVVLAVLAFALADFVYLVTGTDPGGSVVWWTALIGSVVVILAAASTWTEDLLRRAVNLIASGLDLGTVPGVSRYTPSTAVPGHRPRRVLAGSLDSLAPPRSSSTSAGRGKSDPGPEGAPPP